MGRLSSTKSVIWWSLLLGAKALTGARDHRPKPSSTKAGDKSDQCGPCSGKWPDKVETVDYLIVGGGPAGLQTAVDLSRALIKAGKVAKVALVEKTDVFGGNVRAVLLQEPEGYDQSYGPLKADVGAQRINKLTLTQETRLFSEYGIPVYVSPFRNIVNLRGRRHVCNNPIEQAGDSNDIFAFGDFCSYRLDITDPVNGAYRNVRTTNNYTGCVDYTKTDDGTCSIFPSNDPGVAANDWLLQGQRAPQYDTDLNDGNPYEFGDGYTHPLTQQACTAGVDCPIDRCLEYPDLRSYVAGELSLDVNRTTYNDEYANFFIGDNVGFQGVFEYGFGACGYMESLAREWNTPAVDAYPLGGMTSLIDAMVDTARANGVKLYANSPALCIRRHRCARGTSRSSYKYEVRTPSVTFHVKKFMFLAVPSTSLEDPNVVGGDVMDSLRAQRPFNRVRSETQTSVVMQWPPGKEAWFWRYFDRENGTYSVRTYTDSACFSRLELIDSPWHRCTNAIRAVYSDFTCRALWVDLITQAQATGNWSKLQERAMVELRGAFPEMNNSIPDPILTRGHIFPEAWHSAKPEYDDISSEQHAQWAATPLGSNEPICMMGEFAHTYYAAWVEGALRSSRQCLTTRFPGNSRDGRNIGVELTKSYAARDAIAPGSGWLDSPNFADVAPAINQKHFANEQWWPYDYNAAFDNNDFCTASNVRLTNYPYLKLDS